MKKILFIGLLIGLIGGLTSCDLFKSFSKEVQSDLEEGTDYLDHSTTFDGKDISYDESMWYVNELKDVPLPDPYVFVLDDTYYIVGTSDRDGNVVDCYSTKDFVDYKTHLGIFNPNSYNGWENKSKASVYAPEIYEFDGKYYLYYSAIDNDGVRRNSVVVSDNVLGPYEPIVNNKVNGLKSPIFVDQNKSFDVLDISVFVDEDEQMYMYYSVKNNENQHIVGVKLNSPYEADWTTYKKLVIPGALNSSNIVYKPLNWEMFRQGLPIAEAPYMIKSNDKYYLTYSVNGCWNKYYNVCYAVSDSPLGDFEKPFKTGEIWTNLLLGYPGTKLESSTVYKQWSGFASGTGHHCFFKVGDQTMIGYHAHKNRNWNVENKFTQRYFAFDYVHFDSEGVPFCNGPTNSIQPLPEGLSGYKNIAATAKIKVENVENEKAINDNYIVDCYNLTGEKEKEVSLGKEYSFIELEFDQEYTIAGIAIYNSAFYESMVTEINYIDFGDGNAVLYPAFASGYINEDESFVYPGGAITIEFYKLIKSNKVTICFNLPEGASINEIVVLGC